jgi:hypothetical protein
MQSVAGNMPPEDQQLLKDLLNQFGDVTAPLLTQAGFPLTASPLWRPWNLVAVKDSEKVLFCFFATARLGSFNALGIQAD